MFIVALIFERYGQGWYYQQAQINLFKKIYFERPIFHFYLH